MKVAPMPNYNAHNQFLRNRKEKEIYLGINTNINCFDDWCPNDSYGVVDHKIGLFLGKIIFKKNKYGNLAPKYIPSNIEHIEQEVEKLNPLWLDEINKGYKPPVTPLINTRYPPPPPYPNARLYPNNLKMLCKNTPKNITLTKDQIISYFTELHTLNTTFIKNYIDSINKNNGIKANILHDTLYDELLGKGILQKDMFEWYRDGKKRAYSQAKLLALDYLKTTNHSNFTIVFFDELFYAYLVWSLKEFTILYYSGYIAEQKNMLFNLGAYVDDRKLISNENYETLGYRMGRYFYEYYIDMLTPEAKEDFRSFCNNAYGYSSYYNETTFLTDPSYYIPTDEAGHSSRTFQSPNRIYRTYPATGKPIYDDKEPPIYAPSPLGNYYFELTDNIGTFIEFFQRIYPSIDNPPKGWNKEMMKKLELKLE